MHPLTLLPSLVALAFAVSFSHAAETYTGSSHTDFGAEKRAGQFELTVDGSKIAGRVFSPALSHKFRILGTVNKAGRFSIRSANDGVKGRITGTIRGGRLQGRGRLRSKRQSVATVTLAGQRKPLLIGEKSIEGVYVCVPDNWDAVLYSWAHVTIVSNGLNGRGDYGYTIVLAGKGNGDRWDEVKGTINYTDGGNAWARLTGTSVWDYVIEHTIRNSVAHMAATVNVTTDRNQVSVTVVVTTRGWDFISPDRNLQKRSVYRLTK